MSSCLYCGKSVKNKFCNVSCQNRYYNPKRKGSSPKRNKKKCPKCEREISLSNFSRHLCEIKQSRNDDLMISDNQYQCPYCLKIYSKHGIGSHIWLQHTSEGIKYKDNKDYNSGFDWKADTDKLEKAIEKWKEWQQSDEFIPSFSGKSHSQKTKEILSKTTSKRLEEEGRGGFKNIKWYKATNILGEEFTIRGSYEKQVAEFLNENDIVWKRKIYLKYVDDGVKRTYTPDFYIPEKELYIETKGYFSRKDRRKMELVLKQNDIKLKMIFKKDLENLDEIFNISDDCREW